MDIDRAKLASRELWDQRAGSWADRYDVLWERTKHVSEWMLSKAAPREGETVLELAAGPAETSLVAAGLVGPDGRVIVTDFSAQMVERARQRAEGRRLENLEFRVLDAEKMDIESGLVDVVLCRWGFMLMLDPDAALRESARVLRTRGRIALATWADAAENPWTTILGPVLVPRGILEPSDQRGPGGMFSMSTPSKVQSQLEEAGFADVEVDEVEVTFREESFDVYFERQLETPGPVADALASLRDPVFSEVRDAIRQSVEPFEEPDGSIALPGLALVAFARKR